MVWAVSLSTMDLSTHCLTPEIRVCGIRSLTGLGNPWRAPHPISALPPQLILEASPKAISGRTSYLRVRLEFLRYPHLIPAFFNMRGFGSTPTYSFALFRLAFAAAPSLQLNLARERNSPVHSTKGTPSHIKSALTFCKHTVSGSFSLRSRGAFHLSLTVLLHYRSLG